ncbi:MAG: capsule biosynthesis protein [Cyanobacteria bacterium HKST-UBA01]|nr:capsule biosynthesis protein [Cyanobacteria bacterium HKST-UBA01]
MKEKIFKFFIEAFGRQVPDSVAPTSVSPEVVRSGDWLWDGYSWIPEWESILGEDWSEWKKLSQTSKSGPKVLIATSVGGNSTLTPLETLFAMALTLRGADVHFLLCDKTLPACQNCSGATLEEQKSFVENGPSLCDWCYETGSKAIEQLGLTVHKYSSLLDKSDWLETQELVASCSLEEILSWDKDGLNLGEIVQSASLRFFGRSDFEGESLVSPVVKKYMQSALLSNIALEKLFKNYRFEHTVINQGIYVPQANAVAAARRNNSHVVTWDIAYRELCINLSHDDTFIKNNSEEPSSTWEEMFWSEDTLAEIKEYMIGRWTGKFDWLQVITGEYSGEPDSIARELGIDSSKPTIGLLTNVIWDAQLAYPNNAFQNQMEWIISTIEYFKSRPDLNLLIRVHPAEVKSWIRTKQMAVEEIKKSFSTLPENVFVIPPESKINTYKAMTNCNAVLIYGTTTGLEMACMRLPVIVAGQAWIRNKGISEDVIHPKSISKLWIDYLLWGVYQINNGSER